MTKNKKIKELLAELDDLKRSETDKRFYVRHQPRVTPDDVEFQTKLAKLTNKINILKYGR